MVSITSALRQKKVSGWNGTAAVFCVGCCRMDDIVGATWALGHAGINSAVGGDEFFCRAPVKTQFGWSPNPSRVDDSGTETFLGVDFFVFDQGRSPCLFSAHRTCCQDDFDWCWRRF
jgi:hypothetical protein